MKSRRRDIFFNSDHKLITFNKGKQQKEESETKWDFKNTSWSDWKEATKESLQSWLETRSDQTDIDEDYESLVNAIQQTAKKVIKTKQVCSHSKGYWTKELTELNKLFKKAKHRFYKRSDSSNAKIVDDLKNKFLSAVEFAKEKHLNNIIYNLNPSKPCGATNGT